MATQILETLVSPAPKKKLVRRVLQDRSQRIRHTVQWAFVVLNAWLGVQFYLWVRYFERGGQGLSVPRPPGVEGWLPIAGLMNLKYFVSTGEVPAIHPAAMFLLMAFLAISLLMKKAFCSWLCPVGTLSENLWKVGRKISERMCEHRDGWIFPCVDSSICCWASLPSLLHPCLHRIWVGSCRARMRSLPTLRCSTSSGTWA